MYGGSNSHMFTGIAMSTYIRPVESNMQSINSRKSPAKGFGLVIIKIPKKNHHPILDIILYTIKPTKYNQPNCTKKLQSIQKCKN